MGNACNEICVTDSECGVGPYHECVPRTYFPLVSPPFEGPYGTCIHLCDPVNPMSTLGPFTACGAGFQCQPFTSKIAGMTACVAWSDQPRLGTGEPCTDTLDCEPGHTCAALAGDGGASGDGGVTVCRRWCHVGTNDCSTGSCVASGAMVGIVALGLCP